MSGPENGMERRLGKPGFEEEALPCLDAVYRFALRLCSGNEAEAADATQEAFLRAYRGWGTYTRGTKVLSWLFTICRNVVLRKKETRSHRHEVTATDLRLEGGVESLAPLLDDATPGPWEAEKEFFDSIIDDEVLRAVDALPDEFRDAVVLKDLHDFSYAEIADVLEIPRGTVKSRLHRGRRILAEALFDYAVEVGHMSVGARRLA